MTQPLSWNDNPLHIRGARRRLSLLMSLLRRFRAPVSLFAFLTQLICLAVYAEGPGKDPCEYFFRVLSDIPHETLIRSGGEHVSLWDGKKQFGCEVRFVTDNTLLSERRTPALNTRERADFHRGWRVNKDYVADGPGSGSFGIEKENVFCFVSYEEPAHLDDRGGITQSGTFSITVQCRNTDRTRKR